LLVGGVRTGELGTAETRLLFIAAFLGLSLLTQVRYENVLFLLPAAIYLVVERQVIRRGDLALGLGTFLTFTAVYAYWTLTAGYSYQPQVSLATGLVVAQRDILLNPFLSIPILLVGTFVAILGLPRNLKPMPLLPWLVAFLLIVRVG